MAKETAQDRRGPFQVDMTDVPCPGPLVAIDNHWKSASRYQPDENHQWQRGTHIDSMPTHRPPREDNS
jgi:hypothetical protein